MKFIEVEAVIGNPMEQELVFKKMFINCNKIAAVYEAPERYEFEGLKDLPRGKTIIDIGEDSDCVEVKESYDEVKALILS